MRDRVSDVIVIGAGVVGLSAARFLASRGQRVLVVERRRVGAEASSAAAGILSAQGHLDAESPLLPLALLARDHHARLAPTLREETGIDVERSGRGLLDLALGEAEEGVLRSRHAWQRSRGLTVEWLGAEEVREAEPNLNPAVRAALFVPGDTCLDNVRLTRALAASAVNRGAAILSGRPVTGVVVEQGRVAGVHAGPDFLRAPVVVNAAGAWAGLIGNDPLPPPVEPVRGQMVAFDVAPASWRHVLYSSRGYLVPRSDGRVLAGSTVERAGFDKSVTASGLRAILDLALEIAPILADVRVAETWAGLRPGSPDELPIIGPGALTGLLHAGGLYRNGILLGPLVGEMVGGLVLGQAAPLDLARFSVTRFSAAR
jgi:glycine oxidase